MFEKLLLMVAAMNASFGSWKSPITTDLIVQETISIMEMQTDGENLYWTELHPKEKGRIALIRYDGKEHPLVSEISVRTRVHEYGGGAFYAGKNRLIFSNDADKQLYSFDPSGKVHRLTDIPTSRFADGCGKIWVCEKHGNEVENSLVQIEEGGVVEIASGHDFYSSPRLSPDGKKLAYITWDFPNMQWDSSTLWLADIGEDGLLHHAKIIAGGEEESVGQVQWSPDGVLHFVSDKTGFWNLYRLEEGRGTNLCEMEGEFGIPGWVFGRPTYTFLPDGKILTMVAIKGVDHLAILDPKTSKLENLNLPFTLVTNLVTVKDKVYFIGASPTLPPSILCFDYKKRTYEIVKQSFNIPFGEEWISKGKVLEYPSNGKTGYAFYYPPKNPHVQPPKNEKPPLIVKCHGGPTSRAYDVLSLEIQYWTSRGFALVNVNYGGSTGYGREYMKRLEGNWGIVDVKDCISAAQTLAKKGLVDPDKMIIKGGSSGGYTVLAALTFHDVFAAGTSYYGIGDLEMLYQDTHKFESKYNDRLVAPYPEGLKQIRERSPIHHVDKVKAPLLILQGEEDKIVPPNQAFKIYEALNQRKTPVGMILFEGEGHGFRQAENIKRALDAELYFYSKILGFELSETFKTPPVEIAWLPSNKN